MKPFKILILITVLLAVSASPALASGPPYTVYLPLIRQDCGDACPVYVDSKFGNDSNSGADSQHAIRTIAKVNSLSLNPGAKVLFACGEEWHAEMLMVTHSGAAGKPVTYSSYPAGCADQPRLDGTQPVNAWTLYQPNIYVADLNGPLNASLFRSPDGKTHYAINQLFRGGQRLPMGRWPNLDAGDGGYATVDAQPAGNQLTDSQLPAGNWAGATIHLKVIRWSMINRDVTASAGQTLTLNATAGCWNNSCAGWGYFINNHLNTLDREGEWYYDKTSRKVYLYTSSAPASSLIEASLVLKTDERNWGAINLGTDSANPVHDVIIDNFAVRGWFRSGIVSPTNLHSDENSAITIQNNTIRDMDDSGINLFSWVWGAADGLDGWRGGNGIAILNNRIDGANHFGIHTPSRSTTIENNTIRDIGLIANLNESGMGCGKTGSEGTCTEDGAGLRIYTDNPARSGYGFSVRYNRFENIAYNGIQMFGSSSTFAYNVFDQACIAKGDGGAINTFGSTVHDIQILNNIIRATTGNTDGTQASFRPLFGFGIYIDQNSVNVISRGNTISGSTASGILYQNSSGLVENNILFANSAGSMWAEQVALAGSASLSSFNGNVMVSTNAHSFNLALNSAGQVGSADNNRYYHLTSLNQQVQLNNQGQTFAQWQAASGKDSHGKTGTTAFSAALRLFVNDTAADQTITASSGSFVDLDGVSIGASFVLAPYTSRVVKVIQ